MSKKYFLLGVSLASIVSLFAQAQQHHLPQTLQTRHSVSRSTACLVDSAVESYYDNGWTEDGYVLRTYDSHGNPVQDANPQEGDTTKYINTYDANGYLTSQSTQLFDLMSSSWVVTQKHIYTYDANGHLTRDTEQGADTNNVLTTDYLYTYGSFDSHGNPTTETDIDYSDPPTVDTSEYQYIYTYDTNGNIDTMIIQQWDGSQWENISMDTYTYDTNGNKTSDMEQDWDGSAWQYGYILEDHYSTNANCTSGINDISNTVVSVYPNPFTDKLTITNNAPYQLYNMLGQEVYSTTGKESLSSLPADTYILKSALGTARVVKE